MPLFPSRRFFGQTMLALLLCGVAAPALASERLTFTDREPNVISRPGQYVLRRSVEQAGNGPVVVIAADNVTLDLDGYSLSGPGGKTSVGIAIEGRRNVRIRNGNLSGFGTAVRIADSIGISVEDLTITGQDQTATPPEVGVLAINSRGLRITDNTIANTFLGIFVRGGGSGANSIKHNTVSGGENGQLGICYNPAPGADAATDGPQGDTIAENQVSRFKTGIQISAASRGNIFARNYVAFFETSIEDRSEGNNVLSNNLTAQITQ